MFEGIPGSQDDVLQQLAVREGGDVVVTAEVLGQPLQGLGVDAARVDPLRLRVVDVFAARGHFGLDVDAFEVVEGPGRFGRGRLGGGGRRYREGRGEEG